MEKTVKKIALYMHGGSENHGCEAIVRSTNQILGRKLLLYSNRPYMDDKYGLNQICRIEPRGNNIKKYTPKWALLQFQKRILHKKNIIMDYNYNNILNHINRGDVFFSIGGDNYCGALVPALKYMNEEINKKGADTILWGCSIDPEFIKNPDNHSDLRRYRLILARETMTYNALVEAGFSNIARYYPDPAFTLDIECWELPSLFKKKDVIGINISPYVEKNGKNDQVYENYKKVIEYILSSTDFGVALIPHVVWSESDDRKLLNRLYKSFKENKRVIYIKDQNCMRLKYCISNCAMLITARTHASIAAYSTCVPTLVVGYSMKSRGIALDLFGTTNNYVVNAWDMTEKTNLLKAFQWQIEHRKEIKTHLQSIMPDYIARAWAASEEVRSLLEKVEV